MLIGNHFNLQFDSPAGYRYVLKQLAEKESAQSKRFCLRLPKLVENEEDITWMCLIDVAEENNSDELIV